MVAVLAASLQFFVYYPDQIAMARIPLQARTHLGGSPTAGSAENGAEWRFGRAMDEAQYEVELRRPTDPEGRDRNEAPGVPEAGGSAEADGRRCEVEVPTFRVVVGSSAGVTVGGPRLGEARRPSRDGATAAMNR